MTQDIVRMPRLAVILVLGCHLLATAASAPAAAPGAAEARLYIRKPNLQETLLATRARYQTRIDCGAPYYSSCFG